MRKAVLFLLMIILINNCSSECSDNQIDINSASKEELTEIYQIGESRAEELIDLRPFNSLDELTKINGIGDDYLEEIKNRGLACVSSEYEDLNEIDDYKENAQDKNLEPEVYTENYEKTSEYEKTKEYYEIQELKKEIKELKEEIDKLKKEENLEIINKSNSTKTIKLSPKNIKSEENNSKIDKGNYAFYGLIAFSVIMILLFYMRKNKIREELI